MSLELSLIFSLWFYSDSAIWNSPRCFSCPFKTTFLFPSSGTSCFILVFSLWCFISSFTSVRFNCLPVCPHHFVYLFPQLTSGLYCVIADSLRLCVSQLCISLVVEFLVPGQPLFCVLLEFSIELPFEFISCSLCLALGPKSCLPCHDGNSPQWVYYLQGV